MPLLFILFAVIPITEIAILFEVGDQIGGWNTLGIVLLTAALGAHLVKREGLATLRAAQAKMQTQQLPGQEMLEGACLLIAGALLLTPGFITDIVGFLLVIPLTRRLIAKRLASRIKVQTVASGQFHQTFTQRSQTGSQSGHTFEGEYHTHNEQQIEQSNKRDVNDESGEQKN